MFVVACGDCGECTVSKSFGHAPNKAVAVSPQADSTHCWRVSAVCTALKTRAGPC